MRRLFSWRVQRNGSPRCLRHSQNVYRQSAVITEVLAENTLRVLNDHRSGSRGVELVSL